MSVTERFVELPGVRMHCRDLGAGPVILLLHGMPASAHTFRGQIEVLVAAGYRVVAPDLPGYNLSSKLADVESYDDARILEHMTGLIEALSAGPVHVIGHDRGGWIAWMLAMHRPQLVLTLSVIAVPHPRRMRENLWRWEHLRRTWYVYALQIPWLAELALRSFRFALLRRILSANRPVTAISPADLEVYLHAAARPGALTGMLRYYRANARAVARRDPLWWAPRLPVVHAPTLIVWPTDDRYQTPSAARAHAEDVPDQRLVEVRGGHWVHEENAPAVNAALLDFLAGVSRPMPTKLGVLATR